MKMSIGRQLSEGALLLLVAGSQARCLQLWSLCVCVRACVSLLVGRLVMVAVGEVAV